MGIYLLVLNNILKFFKIEYKIIHKDYIAKRFAHGRLDSWEGKSLPSQRSLAGLKEWTATLGLRMAQTL